MIRSFTHGVTLHSKAEIDDYYGQCKQLSALYEQYNKRRERDRAHEICRLLEYLLILDSNARLTYPVSVKKTESPDFLLKQQSLTIGLEITRATTEDYQRWLNQVGEHAEQTEFTDPHASDPNYQQRSCDSICRDRIEDKSRLVQAYKANYPQIDAVELLLCEELDNPPDLEALSRELYDIGFFEESQTQYFDRISLLSGLNIIYAINQLNPQILNLQ